MSAKPTSVLVAALLALCNSVAFAQDGAGRDVDMTRFCARQSSRPHRYYPERAMEHGQQGAVTLDCILADNAVTSCRVLEETNPTWGFDTAALGIACNFTLQRGPDGAMTLRHAPSESTISTDDEGRTHARVPVRFRLEVAPPPPPHP